MRFKKLCCLCRNNVQRALNCVEDFPVTCDVLIREDQLKGLVAETGGPMESCTCRLRRRATPSPDLKSDHIRALTLCQRISAPSGSDSYFAAFEKDAL